MKIYEDELKLYYLAGKNKMQPPEGASWKDISPFRVAVRLNRAFFLMLWGNILFLGLTGLHFGLQVLATKLFDLYQSWELGWLGTAYVIYVFCLFISIPLPRATKFFWKCPCGGAPFPYNVPTRAGKANMNKETADLIRFKGIACVTPKFSYLHIPAQCPYCYKSFF